MKTEEKIDILKKNIKKLGTVVVAFSGGVDSTFLLRMCKDVLGKENCLAVTAKSETYPGSEFKEAKKYAKMLDVSWLSIESQELKIKNFKKNPTDRCYYCKKELFTKLKEIAVKKRYKSVVDGTNYDDIKDYRPGMKAAKETGVISPLKISRFTKEDIRKYSKKFGLPTWNKPSFACLASRFPYGEMITGEKLRILDKAEMVLKKFGFKQIRVRYHQNIARIEIEPSDFNIMIKNRKEIIKKIKKYGFKYITFDLEGYRTGSMNE